MRLTATCLFALAVALSGCASAPPEIEPPAGASTVGELRADDVALECRPPPVSALAIARGLHACFEPTIAADASGRLYVANVRNSDIATTTDGSTWRTLAPPPPPSDLHASRSDITLNLAPSGRLYWSSITFQTADAPNLPRVLGHTAGIQVAWSDDEGATWTSTHLTSVGAPPVPLAAPDRQWLAFGPGEEVYLTFVSGSGDWTARSDDGGASWSTWARIADGPPLVTNRATVLVGQCPFDGSLLIHRSTDRGQTYTTTPIAEGGCLQWPILAQGPEQTLLVAWWTGRAIHVATSRDDGATWGEPTAWVEDAVIGAWPIVHPDGTLDLVWHGPRGDPRVHVTTGPHDGAPTAHAELDERIDLSGGGRSTDYAVAARMPDGRVAIPYAQPHALRLVLAG